jgi:hypothetical protein
MMLNYVPLLRVARELQGIPRGMARFRQYLRTISNEDGSDIELTPLLIMNPMGKDHVTALLDALLEMDADAIATDAAAEASARLADVSGDFRTGLAIADDRGGGWTNRYDWEFTLRFGPRPLQDRFNSEAMWRRYWVTGVLWSSEAPTEQAVREAVLTAAYRLAYGFRQHGGARSIRAMMAQEGSVMAMAGCTGPVLDEDDLAYTREVLTPFLDADDKRTAIECLFGDAAGRTLGFTPRGLSPWAGLALALHDARTSPPARPVLAGFNG